MIVWNEVKLQRLAEAIRTAEREGGDVEFKEVPLNRVVTRRWPLDEAKAIYAEARADLSANPMPVYPENREGQEP